MESILHSARDANNVLIEERGRRIKEFLSKSFEAKYRPKTMGGQFASSILFSAGVLISGDLGRSIGEVNMQVMEEHNMNKNNLKQKFDHAINKIDSMSAIRLNQVLLILRKYDLERILDTINAECVEVKPIRKRNTTRP